MLSLTLKTVEKLQLKFIIPMRLMKIKKEKLSIPWIELKSETVIENPFLWRCHDFRFRLGFCKDCINHFMDVIRLCDKHKIDRNLYTPLNIPNDKKHNYIADIITCYRCKKHTCIHP